MALRVIVLLVLSWMGMQLTFAQQTKPLPASAVPTSVNEYVGEEFKKYQVTAVTEKTKSKATTYVLELHKKNKVVYLTYNEKWELINTFKTKSFTYDKPEQVEPRQNLDEVGTPPL